MQVTSRAAAAGDIPILVRLYHDLAAEQAALRPLWPLADGLPVPLEEAFAENMSDPASIVGIGEIDAVPVGFVLASIEPLLPQAGGAAVGVVRLIFTEPEARSVGVGHAMVESVLAEFRDRGLRLFDARVSPGHRHAKNFFEAHGFSARLIVMHHADDGTVDPDPEDLPAPTLPGA